MKMRLYVLSALCGAMLSMATGVAAQEQEVIDTGKQEFLRSCATCHGADATGQSIFPRRAGQHAAYVVKQLNYIQSLVRAAPVMHGIVKDLTPTEIEDVALYVQSK